MRVWRTRVLLGAVLALPIIAASARAQVAAPPAPLRVVPRRLAPLSPDAKKTLALGRDLQALGGDVDNPCVSWAQGTCLSTALEPFFTSLDALDHGEATAHATIVTLGNSLISSDNVTRTIRHRLVERFGDGGRGLVLLGRVGDFGPRARSGHASAGWRPHNLAIGSIGRGRFGLSGVHHEATARGDRSEWRLAGETRAELFWLDHAQSSGFDLRVDGQLVARVDATRRGQARRLSLSLPDTARRLSLTTHGARVLIYGLALEKQRPGIVFDTIGVPAAEAATYLTADATVFGDQLKARAPRLVMLMLGGNEIRRLARRKVGAAHLREDFAALVERTRAAAPDAACLVVGPIDAVQWSAQRQRPLQSRPQVVEVNDLEREVAHSKGCAFFDLFAAMGGSGALDRFFEHGMLNDDLVHPKGKGFELLGEMLADAILRAYAAAPPPARPTVASPTLFAD